MENWKKKVELEVSDWREAKEKSRIPRIDWKDFLGEDLSKWLWKRFSEGWDKKRAIRELAIKVRENEHYFRSRGWNIYKVLENVRISVSARWSEFNRLRRLQGE